MHRKTYDSIIKNEEQLTIKWFVTLFYIISISYDFFYYYIYPKYIAVQHIGLTSVLGYWIYLFMFGLLPYAVYLAKQGKQHCIKYLYFISYTILTIIEDLLKYIGTTLEYQSGNIVEIFILLFSPIFVNKRFFTVVIWGLISKYLLIGLSIQSISVVFPILLLLVFSIMASILLNRFQGYVTAVKSSYDNKLEGIVKAIIASLELKDPYTRGHSQRVANYAQELAIKTGMYTKEELKSFNYACLLHDIGKINIPDQILMKPTKLTDSEYEIIKTHPVVGAKAMEKVEGFDSCIDVIHYHHERWDGKGYPSQLKGEKIPLLARITAIADAFDAMTSSRSYRAALPLEEAYKRMIDGKGTQFDPALIDLFIQVYPSWVELHDQYHRRNNLEL